ncbi:NAD(P)H oxidoreductase RTN4IP1, mitochondrial [Halichoeres trimaculatus]|uniref:NAD(P)H oxidoreductase RTN4IP1, mitochondrial n=1 Tax=Halichoeres trimaculatus TaxID=147232 RepID=UPI003D9E6B10
MSTVRHFMNKRCVFHLSKVKTTLLWMDKQRRLFSTTKASNTVMSAWVIDRYGSNDVLRYTRNASFPDYRYPLTGIIKVVAAGLNPIDISMRGGYGVSSMSMQRDPLNINQRGSEFPLILGRDFSGIIMECPLSNPDFKVGDEVWAAVSPYKQGSLAEFVMMAMVELSPKPKSISHAEAASIPFVGCTAWRALVETGGLNEFNSANKRILIIGGSGGVGTFAIQLMKAWGAHVTVTCSQNAERFLRDLGADHVVDYTAGPVEEPLRDLEKFDLILDNIGGDTERWALGLLKPWKGAKYITLISPFFENTDQLGIPDGMLQNFATVFYKVVKHLANGVHYRWGFFQSDRIALDIIGDMVDAGEIRPVVDETFSFSQVPQAFEKLEKGHARGKTVVQVSED